MDYIKMLAIFLFYYAFSYVTFAEDTATNAHVNMFYEELGNWKSLLRSQDIDDGSESIPYAMPNFYGIIVMVFSFLIVPLRW